MVTSSCPACEAERKAHAAGVPAGPELTRAAGGRPGSCQEGALGYAVLQGVEGDDGQAAPWAQQPDGMRYGLSQCVQLTIHCDAQGLRPALAYSAL